MREAPKKRYWIRVSTEVKELVLLLLKEFSYFTATHQMTKMSIPNEVLVY